MKNEYLLKDVTKIRTGVTAIHPVTNVNQGILAGKAIIWAVCALLIPTVVICKSKNS